MAVYIRYLNLLVTDGNSYFIEAEFDGNMMNLSFNCALLNVNGDGKIYRWEYDMAFGTFDIDLRLISLPFHFVE